MKAIVIVKSKWTGNEYVHPKIFTNEKELDSFVKSWDTTNTRIESKIIEP